MNYRVDIDGLRAIAVIGVVLCHADFLAPGGYAGVDVFFVISGYLITGIILKELRRGSFSLVNFWERRIRRILPALLAVTAANLVVGWFLIEPRDYGSLGKSAVGVFLLISNVVFYRDTGYFAPRAEEMPLLHTWSLAVEEQFYLLLPIFLVLVARIGFLRRVFFPLSLLAVFSFGLSVYGVHAFPSATFYLLPTRTWELLIGSLLAIYPIRWLANRRWWSEAASWIGALLILAPFIWFDENTPFPGLSALPPVAGATLLIASGGVATQLPRMNRLLSWRPLVLVGLISYSLYLWHWPLFAFARYLSLTPLSLTARLLLITASLILGAISWRYVEIPIRSRRVFASRRSLLGASAVGVATVISGSAVIYWSEGAASRLPQQASLFAATSLRDARFMRELDAGDVPQNLTRLGRLDANPQILVWGDSHAMSVLPAIDALCREAGVGACAATHSSTAPVLGYHHSARQSGLGERSLAFNASVVQYIKDARIRVVVLVATWASYFSDQEFERAFLGTLTTLQDLGVTVYFMKDVPVYDFAVPRALISYSRHNWDLAPLAMPPEEYNSYNWFHSQLIPLIIDRGVRILDPLPILQARTRSSKLLPFDSGGSFYSDRRHLSTYGALVLKPLFVAILKDLPILVSSGL